MTVCMSNGIEGNLKLCNLVPDHDIFLCVFEISLLHFLPGLSLVEGLLSLEMLCCQSIAKFCAITN